MRYGQHPFHLSFIDRQRRPELARVREPDEEIVLRVDEVRELAGARRAVPYGWDRADA